MPELVDVELLPVRGHTLDLQTIPPHARPDPDALMLTPDAPNRSGQAESWVEVATGLRVRGRVRRGRFSRRGPVLDLGAIRIMPAEGYAVTYEAVPGMPDLWVVAAVPQLMFVSRGSTGDAKGANANTVNAGGGGGGDGTAGAGFWVNLGVGIGKALSGIVKGFADLFPKNRERRLQVDRRQEDWEYARDQQVQADQDARRAAAQRAEDERLLALVASLNAQNNSAREAIEAEADAAAAAGSAGCARCNGTCGDRYGLA